MASPRHAQHEARRRRLNVMDEIQQQDFAEYPANMIPAKPENSVIVANLVVRLEHQISPRVKFKKDPLPMSGGRG
jgi:hypothetical protein